MRPSRVYTRVRPSRRGFGPPRDYKVFLFVAVLYVSIACATPAANCDTCAAFMPDGILIIPEPIMFVTAVCNALLTEVQLTFPLESVYVIM